MKPAMKPSSLYHLEDSFDERNSFLYFVLGLVSLSRGLVKILTGIQDSGEIHTTPVDTEEDIHPPDEELVDLLR